jgi:Regulator of ribonuclease activity B
MGFFSSLFGCSKSDEVPRFVTEAAFQQNLAKQKKMSPMTLAELHKLGVPESKSLRLEYFFYTDTEAKAQSLAASLKKLQYDAKSEPSAGNARQFLVTGWSAPIRMSEQDVVSWTDQMCRLGFEHDADFDGWGTSPN